MEVLEDAEKAWKTSGSDEDLNTFVHNNGIPMLLILPTINKDIGLETEQCVPLTLAYLPA